MNHPAARSAFDWLFYGSTCHESLMTPEQVTRVKTEPGFTHLGNGEWVLTSYATEAARKRATDYRQAQWKPDTGRREDNLAAYER